MRILKKPTIERTDSDKATLAIQIPLNQAKFAESAIENVDVGDYTIEIKKERQKRSLTANAYAWKLIHQIAELQGIYAIEVYRQQIANMYTYHLIEVDRKAVNSFMEHWRNNGIGWLAEILEVNNNKCIVKCNYGSSTFNSKEMSDFISGLVQDCNELNIPTESPEWIEKSLKLWGDKNG